MGPIDFISIGMSFIGFAIAFVALTIAFKTDDTVKSLTYLNFDEKRAIIAAYINFLTPEHYHDSNFKNNLLRFESDILAVSRIQENILDEDKQLFIQFVNPHIKLLKTNLDNFEDGEVKTSVENIVRIKDRIVLNLSISENTHRLGSSQIFPPSDNEQLIVLKQILTSLNKGNTNTERYTKGIGFLSFIATMIAIESFLFTWMEFNNSTIDLVVSNNLAIVGIGLMLLNAVTIIIFWGYFLIPKQL